MGESTTTNDNNTRTESEATTKNNHDKPITKDKKLKIKDSVLVYIPMDVTADMGIAMRRTRTKRLKKIRALYPSLFPSKQKSLNESKNGPNHDTDTKESSHANGVPTNNANNNSKEIPLNSSNGDGDSVDGAGGDNKKVHDHLRNTAMPRREQYGSVLDYLEAKYVRGVMLDDIDERRQRKKDLKRKERRRQKKLMKQKEKHQNNKNEGNSAKESSPLIVSGGSSSSMHESDCDISSYSSGLDDDDDSDDDSGDGTGSCYSDASGFLDDSLLRTAVAEQFMASSSYGATRIEAESKKSSQQNKLNNNTNSSGDVANNEFSTSLDMEDGFFVNVGDLEMVDGYDDADAADIDFDFLDSATNHQKKKKQKKKDKETNNTSMPNTNKSNQGSSKTKANTGSGAFSLSKENQKLKTNELGSSSSKKRKNSSNASVNSSTSKTTFFSQSKKKIKKSKKNELPSNATTTNLDTDINDKGGVGLPPQIKRLREKCDAMKKEMKRLYQLCVQEIKKMTTDHLPRKRKKKKEMIKVSITIPQHKKAGDEIQFANPRVPGQRLKVQVPESGQPGKSFVVSVPAPPETKSKTSTKNKGNIFTKSAREVLDYYSKAYDNWIEMETKYHESAPDGDRKYKPGHLRQRKFDKLLTVFPSDLLEPIDASFLRKQVRRSRQNRSKRIKARQQATMDAAKKEIKREKLDAENSSDTKINLVKSNDGVENENNNEDEEDTEERNDKKDDVESDLEHCEEEIPSKNEHSKYLSLNVPGKGKNFPLFTFERSDFLR